MPIKVIVHDAEGGERQLVFDNTQRVVIGRGAGCEVRLPDQTVSLRHAVLSAKGADFAITDEGSSNGTWIGGARVAPKTHRLVRSGDMVRLGRVWLELRIDQGPVTRDVAAATRDLALRMLAAQLEARGEDLTTRVRVVEGNDAGAALPLAEEGRLYLVGRGSHCALPLADEDASREHAAVARVAGGGVVVRDLGAKNGTWVGGARLPPNGEVAWRSSLQVQVGGTVLALEEPVIDALAHIEDAPDEALPPAEAPPPPAPPSDAATGAQSTNGGAQSDAAPSQQPPIAPVAPAPAAARAAARERRGLSIGALLFMGFAAAVVALALAALLWITQSPSR